MCVWYAHVCFMLVHVCVRGCAVHPHWTCSSAWTCPAHSQARALDPPGHHSGGYQRPICSRPGPRCPGAQESPAQRSSCVVSLGQNMECSVLAQNSERQLEEPEPAPRPLQETQVHRSPGMGSTMVPSSGTTCVTTSTSARGGKANPLKNQPKAQIWFCDIRVRCGLGG